MGPLQNVVVCKKAGGLLLAAGAALLFGGVALAMTSGLPPLPPGQVPVPPCPNPPPPGMPLPPARELPEVKWLVEAVNRLRTERGLSKLTVHPGLTCAGKVHALDLSKGGLGCGHAGRDGSQFWQRAAACGFTAADGFASGEVVACGYPAPDYAVEGWMNSPSHRRIMLDPEQKTIGGASFRGYHVVVFGKNQ